jgi:hypothetical protein
LATQTIATHPRGAAVDEAAIFHYQAFRRRRLYTLEIGNGRTNLLSRLITGILIGTYLGGTMAHVLSEGTLRVVFAAVLIWTGARYLRTKRPAQA